MKKLIISMAFAALIAGCARHTETTGQGGGYYDNTGAMGTDTNGTNQSTIPQGTGSGSPQQPQ